MAVRKAFWPIGNVLRMLNIDGPPARRPNVHGDFSGGKLLPYQPSVGAHFQNLVGAQLPKIVLALFCWYSSVDMVAPSNGYDVSIAGWVWRIVLRDLLVVLIFAGGWDWLLRLSPLARRLAPFKYDQANPDAVQMRRDIFWSISATLLVSVQEIVLVRWWAGGLFKRALFSAASPGEVAVPWGEANPFFGGAWRDTLGFVLWGATVQYWRSIHFFIVHRAMHPWWDRDNSLQHGDIGAVLYRYVHSHHHKSHNPTAWSGISMLPIESVIYLSAALVPILFRSGCHPLLVLYAKIILLLDAVTGHDGFDNPGAGTYFHQLHHAHFECNYGTVPVPMDWLFGTFSDGRPRFKPKSPAHEQACHDSVALSSEVVRRHSQLDDCWIALHGLVLDVTRFLNDHPGGARAILSRAGSDVSAPFDAIHSKSGGMSLIKKYESIRIVGEMTSAEKTHVGSLYPVGRSIVHEMFVQFFLNVVFAIICAGIWYALMGAW